MKRSDGSDNDGVETIKPWGETIKPWGPRRSGPLPVFGPSAGPMAEMMKPEDTELAPPKIAQFITPDAEELAADKSA